MENYKHFCVLRASLLFMSPAKLPSSQKRPAIFTSSLTSTRILIAAGATKLETVMMTCLECCVLRTDPSQKGRIPMKKLWILQPVDDSADPWLSYHNCMFEFVGAHWMRRKPESRLPSKLGMKGRMPGFPLSLAASSWTAKGVRKWFSRLTIGLSDTPRNWCRRNILNLGRQWPSAVLFLPISIAAQIYTIGTSHRCAVRALLARSVWKVQYAPPATDIRQSGFW